jgi:hypothetical protein
MDSNLTLTYTIFPVTELYKIDFSQLYSTYTNNVAIGNIRTSVDGTKTFVKYAGAEPLCLSNVVSKEGPYTQSEILTILDTTEWKIPYPFL